MNDPDTDLELVEATPRGLVDVERDWLLQAITATANRGLELGISLQIGGVIVSGRLVGGRTYGAGVGRELGDAGLGWISELIGEQFEEIYPDLSEDISSIEADELQPTFIHLANARVFANDGLPLPGNRGVWWRGRIAAVDAFFIGELSADVPPLTP